MSDSKHTAQEGDPLEKLLRRPLIREMFRHANSLSENSLTAAEARYDYLIERRDRSNDRIRTGLIILNSASLLGVLTALGTDAIAAERFGIGITDLALSASTFILGTMLAATAVMIESWRLPSEAALQFDRLTREKLLRASLDVHLDEKGVTYFEERLASLHELPPKDFEFSRTANWLTNVAGGVWLAGMAIPLYRIGGLVDWFAT